MTIRNEHDWGRVATASAAPTRGVRLSWAALCAGALIGLSSQHAAATPAYAAQTGKPCGYCHVSASGGGALTAAGKEFAKGKHMSLIGFPAPMLSALANAPRTAIRAP